jgi:hypothetical protein
MLNRNQVLATASQFLGVGPEHDRSCYLQITESRADWQAPDGSTRHYGWCGDLATAVLMLCGVTRGDVLNRAALNNGKWTPGDNLARLTRSIGSTGGLITQPSVRLDPDLVQPADLVIFSRPDGDHIAFFSHWLAAGEFETIDGNSWGRVVKRNFRHLVDHPGEMPVRHFLSIDHLPTGGVVQQFLNSETAVSDLSPETIANGGDSRTLFHPGRII